MQAAVERIQAKAELADDRKQLLGLLCLAAVDSHICASLGLDKKLTKSLLDLHHKVANPSALPWPACQLQLPCPAPACPMLCAVLQSPMTTQLIVCVLGYTHVVDTAWEPRHGKRSMLCRKIVELITSENTAPVSLELML